MTRKMKRAALALAAALLCGALSGCGAEEPAVTETFAMDTVKIGRASCRERV